MCALLGNTRLCRRRVKFILLLALFWWLNSNAVHAQDMNISGDAGVVLLRWAITQGGPSVLVLVIGWSYRRDLLGALNEKDQVIDVLINATKQTAETNMKLTAVVEALSVEIRRLESSR